MATGSTRTAGSNAHLLAGINISEKTGKAQDSDGYDQDDRSIPVVLPAAQLQQIVREGRRPKFRDISKFSGALHENVSDWLLPYERYRMVYDWTDLDYQK